MSGTSEIDRTQADRVQEEVLPPDLILPSAHLLQLYSQDSFLLDQVARYVAGGLRRGEGAVFAATLDHCAGISERLMKMGIDTEQYCARGQLVVLDAGDAVQQFADGYGPASGAFDRIVPPALARAREGARIPRVRVFGEVLDLLWRRGEFDAATRFERLWNQLLQREEFTLLCAYRADIFDPNLPGYALSNLIQAHAHLHSGEGAETQLPALERAIDEVLGVGRTQMVRFVVSGRQEGKRTEPTVPWMVAWIRENMPRHAPEVLRLARQYATAA